MSKVNIKILFIHKLGSSLDSIEYLCRDDKNRYLIIKINEVVDITNYREYTDITLQEGEIEYAIKGL